MIKEILFAIKMEVPPSNLPLVLMDELYEAILFTKAIYIPFLKFEFTDETPVLLVG